MKSGLVPIEQVAGAILAHSATLANGKMRKGIFLTSGHITALRTDGHTRVIVARLDVDDVHEDAAAATLATALVSATLPAHHAHGCA